eukprot:CAMPEP_0196598700 /NCGR_PEP_ID=MMETSP1081-20130531/94461_1 /TAXON_ID=36882 /ORGANISM="Pyramimonas amylifera, Strain CCMP720" /LENGTH=512 /DNA_ID=CAMNT_0041924417 /DNA_START=126 /DNA_END=1667 /DNA_ORIENTATION=-
MIEGQDFFLRNTCKYASSSGSSALRTLDSFTSLDSIAAKHSQALKNLEFVLDGQNRASTRLSNFAQRGHQAHTRHPQQKKKTTKHSPGTSSVSSSENEDLGRRRNPWRVDGASSDGDKDHEKETLSSSDGSSDDNHDDVASDLSGTAMSSSGSLSSRVREQNTGEGSDSDLSPTNSNYSFQPPKNQVRRIFRSRSDKPMRRAGEKLHTRYKEPSPSLLSSMTSSLLSSHPQDSLGRRREGQRGALAEFRGGNGKLRGLQRGPEGIYSKGPSLSETYSSLPSPFVGSSPALHEALLKLEELKSFSAKTSRGGYHQKYRGKHKNTEDTWRGTEGENRKENGRKKGKENGRLKKAWSSTDSDSELGGRPSASRSSSIPTLRSISSSSTLCSSVSSESEMEDNKKLSIKRNKHRRPFVETRLPTSIDPFRTIQEGCNFQHSSPRFIKTTLGEKKSGPLQELEARYSRQMALESQFSSGLQEHVPLSAQETYFNPRFSARHSYLNPSRFNMSAFDEW